MNSVCMYFSVFGINNLAIQLVLITRVINQSYVQGRCLRSRATALVFQWLFDLDGINAFTMTRLVSRLITHSKLNMLIVIN